jgi:hypothetical protein
MSGLETKNAVITGVRIDTERCLSAWLNLDYGGTCQGFGGFVLYAKPWDADKEAMGKHLLGNYAGLFIQRCIEIGGVEQWEKLVGKTIRVKSEWTKIHAIGHIVKDDWFTPSIEFEAVAQRIRALEQAAEAASKDRRGSEPASA